MIGIVKYSQKALAELEVAPFCAACSCYHEPGTITQLWKTAWRHDPNGTTHPVGVCDK